MYKKREQIAIQLYKVNLFIGIDTDFAYLFCLVGRKRGILISTSFYYNFIEQTNNEEFTPLNKLKIFLVTGRKQSQLLLV